MKTLALLLIALLMFGCSARTLFPTDNRVYDSIQNYDYDYQEHTFGEKDKTPLYGLFIKPKETPKGLIVVTNGIYQNMSNRFQSWLWIVDRGYEVFIFDYRGYGKSEANIDMYGFRDDVNAAIEYAHSLDADKDVTLVGQSMGGTFAIDALVEKQYEYIDLIVVDSTFTGFASSMNSMMLKSVVLIPLSWLPYTFCPDDLNAIENVPKLETPILFVTGDDDWVVNCENSKELYSKIDNNKSLWIVKDAGHVQSFENPNVRENFLKLLRGEEHLESQKIRYF